MDLNLAGLKSPPPQCQMTLPYMPDYLPLCTTPIVTCNELLVRLFASLYHTDSHM